MVGQSHHASQQTHPLLVCATGKGHIRHIILYGFVAVRKERGQREIGATPSHPAQMCSGRGADQESKYWTYALEQLETVVRCRSGRSGREPVRTSEHVHEFVAHCLR